MEIYRINENPQIYFDSNCIMRQYWIKKYKNFIEFMQTIGINSFSIGSATIRNKHYRSPKNLEITDDIVFMD